MEAKKFGLLLPKKKENSKMKRKSIFDSSSDEETSTKARPKIPQSKPISNKCIKSEAIDDPSIYEYDNIYDEMKDKQKAEILPKEKKNSRYIDTLLKAADKRKKQYERRVEKKVQLEREKEGDKFKDKEAFVTSAYKKKMQEMEEEEERERRENMINDMMDVTKQKDLSGFYRHFLNQTVGDKKLPINDMHHIKEEPLSENEFDSDAKSDSVKRSVCQTQNNDSKKETIHVKNDKSKSTNEQDDNKKQKRILRQRHDSSSNSNYSDETDGGESPSKPDNQEDHKQTSSKKSYRNRKKSDDSKSSSDEEINLEKTKVVESNSSERQPKHKTHHTSSDSSKSEASTDEVHGHMNTNETDRALTDGTENVSRSDDKEAKQRNIFQKRTVGSVFDEAQARYFMRLAARSGTE